MKKIGILTFHRPHNYGANLQAYALQEKLENLGYDTKIIDYRNDILEKSTKIIKVNLKDVKIKGIIKQLITNIIFLPKNFLRKKNFEKFQKEHYNLSIKYRTIEELEKDKDKMNIYMVGSDQVWNTTITNGLEDVYTLNFKEKNAKYISYASSMGNGSFSSENEKRELMNRLEKFDALAVREKSAKELIEKETEKKVEVVLDPTLLLNDSEWTRIIKKERIKEKYILVYTVIEDKEIFKIANKLSEITGMKIVTFRRTNGILKNVAKNLYIKGPEDFVSMFKNASYVVTSSFHGTAFSIIFNKKFFINYCGKENKRIDSLLEILELDGRYIKDDKEINEEKIKSTIEYDKVNKILEKEREKSIRYLKDSIK